MAQPEIVVLKKTKRSEKEVDIKPMIYKMTALDDGIYLYLATGSEQNLKPDLVAEAFLKFAGEDPEEIPVHIHRIDVYAKNPEVAEGQTEFITLEGLGKGVHSLIISLCRYVVVIIPVAFIVSRFMGAVGVWHAFWITEVVVAGISYVICKKEIFQ